MVLTMTNAKQSPYGITFNAQAETSAHIDWISATYKNDHTRSNKANVLPDDHNNGFTIIRATNGYNVARQYHSGAIEQWHTAYPDMGIHVTYTAQALREAQVNFNIDANGILDYLMLGARITRLDMCLDVANAEIDIRQLHSDLVLGKVKTRAQTFDYVESAKKGQSKGASTTYVGSMKKRKKLLRVYDKGMQLGLDTLLTRFELETHGEIAQNAAKTLQDNMSDNGKIIAGMIKAYADFSQTHVGAYFDVDSIPIALPKYQKSDTAKWLIDVVAKTLANEAHKDYNVMETFLQHFQYHYNNLINSEGYNE